MIDIDIEIDNESSIDTDIELSASGTNDYNDLVNKPSIEGVELIGDKTLEELGVEALIEELEKGKEEEK